MYNYILLWRIVDNDTNHHGPISILYGVLLMIMTPTTMGLYQCIWCIVDDNDTNDHGPISM